MFAASTFRVFHRFITLTMEAVSSSENSTTITNQHGVTSQRLQPSSATLWKLQIVYFLLCCSAHIHVPCEVRIIAVIFLFCYSTSIAKNATGLKHFTASKSVLLHTVVLGCVLTIYLTAVRHPNYFLALPTLRQYMTRSQTATASHSIPDSSSPLMFSSHPENQSL